MDNRSILFVALLLVIASCASQPVIKCEAPLKLLGTDCCLDENQNSICDKVEPPKLDITPVVVNKSKEANLSPAAPVVETKQPAVSEATKKWEARIAQKVKSYQYIGKLQDQFHGTFYVKYPKVRVDLSTSIPVNVLEATDNVVNHIYFDMEEKTALGVCEAGFTLCKSRKGESYAVNFEDYKPQLPPDLFRIVENMPLELEQPNAEMLQDRKMTLLRYVDGKAKHSLYIDEFYGLPLKYMVEKGGGKTITEYKSIAYNTVVDADFKLPILP